LSKLTYIGGGKGGEREPRAKSFLSEGGAMEYPKSNKEKRKNSVDAHLSISV